MCEKVCVGVCYRTRETERERERERERRGDGLFTKKNPTKQTSFDPSLPIRPDLPYPESVLG